MRIEIRSYLAGSHLLESEPNRWDAIVILDSALRPSNFVREFSKQNVILSFDDIVLGEVGKQRATLSHLELALELAKDSENLLVCCRAGQSRSAATAFVVGYALRGREYALSLLNPERHIPNSFVVEQGTKLLGRPEILHDFRHWRAEHRHIELAAYYDAIEAEVLELERQGARDRITQ